MVHHRDILLSKFHDRRIHTSLRESEHYHPPMINPGQLNHTYRRINHILQEKQKNKPNYRSRVKYHNPLQDFKPPFIDKSKLVSEPSLF